QIAWMQSAFGFGREDRILQKTASSFDVSVWELFAPLVAGGCVVLARPGEQQEPDRLAGTVRDRGITGLRGVPGLLEALLREPAFLEAGSLRWLGSGGEPMPPSLGARLLERFDARVVNLYGPTECAVVSTWWECRAGAATDRGVPIGHPVANVHARILDERLQPVPAGVPGELCVGGAQVGRGYLGRPDLTAERFVPDPFSTAPGARLYRTGDLVRYRPEGEIELLGRLDFQVKVRGFRIELGEIEAQLLRRGGLRSAVALVREDAPGDPRLVAYVVPEPGTETPDLSASLRRSLGEVLPPYMVPAAVVVLEELPRLPNGKVDRRSLPAPEWAGSRESWVAPRTPTEEIVSAVFSE